MEGDTNEDASELGVGENARRSRHVITQRARDLTLCRGTIMQVTTLLAWGCR